MIGVSQIIDRQERNWMKYCKAMDNTAKQSLIDKLEHHIRSEEESEFPDDPNGAGWGSQEGIIISTNQAKLVLDALKPAKSIITDDIDINANQLIVALGGNGDYYIQIKDEDGKSLAVRVATSGSATSLEVRLAIANLYRALQNTPVRYENKHG